MALAATGLGSPDPPTIPVASAAAELAVTLGGLDPAVVAAALEPPVAAATAPVVVATV